MPASSDSKTFLVKYATAKIAPAAKSRTGSIPFIEAGDLNSIGATKAGMMATVV